MCAVLFESKKFKFVYFLSCREVLWIYGCKYTEHVHCMYGWEVLGRDRRNVCVHVYKLPREHVLRALRAAVEHDMHAVLPELGVARRQRPHRRLQLLGGLRVFVRSNVRGVSIYDCVE